MATSEHQRQTAEITVSIDSTLKVEYRVRGADALMVGLLGAVRMSESWIEERIRSVADVKMSVDGKPLCDAPAANSLTTEVSMSKDAALVAYWNAAQKIGERMRAIAAADDLAIYDVPLPLLKAL